MAESFETHEPNAIPETETFTPSVSKPHETLSQTAASMTTQEETIGGKLAVQPVSMAFILTLAVALLAGGLSAISIKQLLLPIQVSLIDPSNANGSFTLIASLSAALGMVASPVLGAFSDRTTGRWGRRRPWIVFGLLTLVTGLLIMAFAATIATLLLGEIVIQIGNDTLFATLNALIPDLVPPQQRRLAAAAGGIAPTFGGVIGLLLVNGLTNTRIPAQGYGLLAAVSVLLVLGLLVVLRERPLAAGMFPSVNMATFLASLIRPLGRRDFALVFASRFLAFLGFTILGAYLLFSMRTGNLVSIPVAASRVTTFQVVSTCALLIASLVVGMAKQSRPLKALVVLGAVLMAVGLLVLVIVPIWPYMLLSACIFGAGFGIYLAADLALAIAVLPRQEDSGKDLGLLNMTIFLSLIISPLLGGAIIAMTHSYVLLFGLAALSCAGAAGMIVPIKTVR